MTSQYIPEFDGTPALDAKDTQCYQKLIDKLRWPTKIGRIDILHEVTLLSQYQASPRRGHLEQLLHVFTYLDKKPKVTLYIDPTLPKIDSSEFKTERKEFLEHYRYAKKKVLYKISKQRGRSVSTTTFDDASFASNKKTKKSHTGYTVFINRDPVL